MADGRGRHEWAQTALVCHLIYAANKAPGAPNKGPADFSPYAARGGAREPDVRLDPKQSMAALKAVFGRR